MTGYSHPCEVSQIHRTAANDWSAFRYQDVAPGGFVIGIDTRRIDRHAGRWQLQLTVRAGGVERNGPITAVAPGGVGHLMWGRNLRGLDEVNRVVPKLDPQLGFMLHVRPERVRALALTTDGAAKAAGSLRLVDPGLGALVSVTAVSPFGQVAAELGKAGTDGSQPFELDMPVGVGPPLDGSSARSTFMAGNTESAGRSRPSTASGSAVTSATRAGSDLSLAIAIC